MKSWFAILAFLDLFWNPNAVKVKCPKDVEDVQIRADNVSVVKNAHANLSIDSVRRHTFTVSSSMDLDVDADRRPWPVQYGPMAAGHVRNMTTQWQRFGILNQIEGDPMLARSVELVNSMAVTADGDHATQSTKEAKGLHPRTKSWRYNFAQPVPTGVLQSTARPLPNRAAAEVVGGDTAIEAVQAPILPQAQGNGSSNATNAKKRKGTIQPVYWGPGCIGYWSAWSDCGKECFLTRTWIDLHRNDPLGDHPCPDTMPPSGRIDTQNCHWGECPLQTKEKHVRSVPVIRSVGLERVVQFLQLMAFPLSVIMLLALMLTSLVRRMNNVIENLPDQIVIMAFTAVLGLVIHFPVFRSVNFGPWGDEVFNSMASALLMYFVLPITTFARAYQSRFLDFWSELISGLIFGIFGALFQTIIIALMVKASADIGWHPVNTWREAFCYAAALADTDPNATTDFVTRLKTDALVTVLVAGESTLIDSVTLAIFIVTNLPGKMTLRLSHAIEGAVKLFAGSIAIGIVMGLVLVLLFNIFSLHGNGQLERAYMFLCAFASFHAGECVGMSGVVSCGFCALMMGIYLRPNLAEPGKADTTMDDVATLMDSITFVLVGIGVIRMELTYGHGLVLGLLSIVFCIFARGLVFGGLMWIVNRIKKARGFPTVPRNTTIVFIHSGIRGAVTLVMALNIDNSWTPNKKHIIDGTMILVMGLNFIIGTTGPFMLRVLGVPHGDDVPQEDGTLFVETDASNFMVGVHSILSKLLVWRKPAEEEGRANAPEDAAH